jgi:hypothetical protein
LRSLKEHFETKRDAEVGGLGKEVFKELVVDLLKEAGEKALPSDKDLDKAFTLADVDKSNKVDEDEFIGLYSMVKSGDVHGLSRTSMSSYMSSSNKKHSSFQEKLQVQKSTAAAEKERLASSKGSPKKKSSWSKAKKDEPATALAAASSSAATEEGKVDEKMAAIAPQQWVSLFPSVTHAQAEELLSATIRVYEAMEKGISRGLSDADGPEALKTLTLAWGDTGTKAVKYVDTSAELRATDWSGAAQAAVLVSDAAKRVTIVFRGTEPLKDWAMKTKISKVKLHDDVAVNGGFFGQLEAKGAGEEVMKAVLRVLEDKPGHAAFVTGHSLGGALATLFGYQLARKLKDDGGHDDAAGPSAAASTPTKKSKAKKAQQQQQQQPVTVVSFGSPRVGNAGFKRAFGAQPNLAHLRVTHGRDPLTALPNLGYQHVGYNLFVEQDPAHAGRLFDEFGGADAQYPKYWKYSLLRCWKLSDHEAAAYLAGVKSATWTGPLSRSMAGQIGEAGSAAPSAIPQGTHV